MTKDLASSFSSIQEMLRWQIGDLRVRAQSLEKSIPNYLKAFPPPMSKPDAWKPKNWAFGEWGVEHLDQHMTSDGFKWIFHEIEKAEIALAGDDFPTALQWIYAVNRRISGFAGGIASAHLSRLWRHQSDRVTKTKAAQKEKARSVREKTDAQVKQLLVAYREQGKPEHSLNSLIAKKLGMTPQGVAKARKRFE